MNKVYCEKGFSIFVDEKKVLGVCVSARAMAVNSTITLHAVAVQSLEFDRCGREIVCCGLYDATNRVFLLACGIR